jgi:hypothetical protein
MQMIHCSGEAAPRSPTHAGAGAAPEQHYCGYNPPRHSAAGVGTAAVSLITKQCDGTHRRNSMPPGPRHHRYRYRLSAMCAVLWKSASLGAFESKAFLPYYPARPKLKLQVTPAGDENYREPARGPVSLWCVSGDGKAPDCATLEKDRGSSARTRNSGRRAAPQRN